MAKPFRSDCADLSGIEVIAYCKRADSRFAIILAVSGLSAFETLRNMKFVASIVSAALKSPSFESQRGARAVVSVPSIPKLFANERKGEPAKLISAFGS